MEVVVVCVYKGEGGKVAKRGSNTLMHYHTATN